MKKLIYLLAGFLLLLFSCKSPAKIMNSYLGKTKQEVIMAFGVPLQVASDGNNGEILIYNKSGYIPGSTGFVTPGTDGRLYQGRSTYGSYYSRNVSIYVNSQNIVYHWLIN